MSETLKEDYKEIEEEALDKAEIIGFRIGSYIQTLMDSPVIKPMLCVVGLTTAYFIGKRKGMKLGRIEYVCDPDIEGIAKHGFETAAHLLDVFDEIESLSKTK